MPKSKFSNRLLFDFDFYKENQGYKRLLLKLMYISANSSEYKKCHNIMSRKDFNDVSKSSDQPKEFLRLSFKPIDEPESIEIIEDSLIRNIKYAIYLGNKTPYKTIIFTSKDKHNNYKNHPQMIGIKNVLIRSGEEALKIIEEYYFQVTAK